MKATLEAAKISKPVVFPALMENKHGHIILFKSINQGTCVGNSYSDMAFLGETCGWNSDLCKPFLGRVILDGSE